MFFWNSKPLVLTGVNISVISYLTWHFFIKKKQKMSMLYQNPLPTHTFFIFFLECQSLDLFSTHRMHPWQRHRWLLSLSLPPPLFPSKLTIISCPYSYVRKKWRRGRPHGYCYNLWRNVRGRGFNSTPKELPCLQFH